MEKETISGAGSETTAQRQQLRVLFVSHDGALAGAQRALLTLLTAIDRKRFEPHVIVPFEGPLSEAASSIGVKFWVRHLVPWLPGVRGLSQSRARHALNVLGTLRSRSWAVANLILRHQIDLVYTNTVTCVEGAVAARMARKPHVWHIHEAIRGNADLMPLLPLGIYSRFVRTLSASVIFCSSSLADAYPHLAKKGVVVHNGLPFPSSFDRTGARRRVSEQIGIGPATRIVAVVAELNPRKDHDTFLQAAKKTLQQIEDVVFLIVGSGSESQVRRIRDKIESLGIAPSVRITGWWREDKIYELLAAIDVLVISSEQEPFGLTAIEALAVETPVVSTRCGGPEEIIRDGRTGSLVPIRDPSAMAAAIVRLLDLPRAARDFGQDGRRDVLARFGVDRYARRIEDVMQMSASGSPDFSLVEVDRLWREN